jgi:hypothetical protein
VDLLVLVVPLDLSILFHLVDPLVPLDPVDLLVLVVLLILFHLVDPLVLVVLLVLLVLVVLLVPLDLANLYLYLQSALQILVMKYLY